MVPFQMLTNQDKFFIFYFLNFILVGLNSIYCNNDKVIIYIYKCNLGLSNNKKIFFCYKKSIDNIFTGVIKKRKKRVLPPPKLVKMLITPCIREIFNYSS